MIPISLVEVQYALKKIWTNGGQQKEVATPHEEHLKAVSIRNRKKSSKDLRDACDSSADPSTVFALCKHLCEYVCTCSAPIPWEKVKK